MSLINSLILRVKKFFNYLKSHKKILVPSLVILILIIYFLLPKNKTQIPTETVKAYSFTQSISVSGKINAAESANLTFLLAGKLVYLGVKEGDMVTAGQTIGVLDQRTTLKNLQDALIDYSKQRGTFDDTKKENQDRTPTEALNDSMRRILINNQYDLEKAVISVEIVDLAKQQSVLTSPISGIVTRADVKIAGVAIGTTTTFSVVSPNTLIFEVDVDQADIAKVKEGQEVNVNLDSYPNDNISLNVQKIDFVTHTTSNGGNAYTVQSDIPTSNKFNYKVGMEGNAEIITAKEDNVLSVPLSSIIDDNYVYIEINKKYEKRKIKQGLQNDTDVIVTEGLVSGDKVVLDPTLVPQKKQGKFLGLF
ncbi:MAG: hypothetical protein CO135_00165 [Candidatus Levybacteria bacterium CG_4_9_14_3_um_filter_35_16]|nr:MAG: hypothetical protein COW87_02060 [Candidatus Levybacteria bacterium CG22_combo_CG10-13_8_21_14_all_35_11]PIY94038.1 MAG: hypothetical protein COY68_04140 [Candidatus Levybacteria bacterium CG_4_10_14_0_8_um_filter_35_23]PIZ98824.1 MAG: hypothetical protein COX78_02660 [Candidatus Levybacteria bacterium CG_4_10_14_0_2_um_filter_35_8]PJA91633.1 MAG: hypothetical protein CO135_00165 [Candidatus Levybacteria bacterium CG_4_9_14_3_um_filter_35_16]PJC54639.1 MAG: hypothetical protein CO028_01